MKATLSFSLPEESVEHLTALHGAEWKSVVWELAEQLRRYRKYGHPFKTPEQLLEEIETLMRTMQESRGLFLE